MENVESTNQLQTSDEQTTSELINNSITQSQKEVTEKTPVAENETEVKNNKNSTPQVTTNNKQPIVEVNQENTEIKKIITIHHKQKMNPYKYNLKKRNKKLSKKKNL